METGESIFNLVHRDPEPELRPPMYRSMHDHQSDLAGSTIGCRGTTRLLGAAKIVKHSGSTFGPSDPLDNGPVNFLRKMISPESKTVPNFHYQDNQGRKPSIPSSNDYPVLGLKTDKDYVTANAIEAILSVPPLQTDVPPNYLEKEDYGQVPMYLADIQKEIDRENTIVERYLREKMGGNQSSNDSYEEMKHEERQQLVNELKTKWDTTNAAYQQMVHHVTFSTVGGLRKKQNLEANLDKLEKYIEQLERPGPVVIQQLHEHH